MYLNILTRHPERDVEVPLSADAAVRDDSYSNTSGFRCLVLSEKRN